MQIAVCDDEKEIRDMFADKIQRICPEANLKLYKSGEELLVSDRSPDIVLLDIQMPGKNGMETARELRRNNKKAIIIFITVLEEYVFEAFDVGAFNYILKPFDDRKFEKVLIEAITQLEERKKLEDINAKTDAPSIMITTGGKHIIVHSEDIIYAEVFNRKMILHTIYSDIEYYGKMKELEKKVGDGFYRSHRAYLVNFSFIRKYDATTIYLEKGQALMAKQNYHEFVKCYLKYNQKKGK